MTERMGFRNGGGIQSKASSMEFRRMKYLRKESSIREAIVGITNIGIRRWLVWSSSSRIRPNYRTEGGDKRDIVALRAGRNAR